MKLETRRLGKNWWITGDGDGLVGPYNTEEEADEERRGLNRTILYFNEHDFWTSEKEVRNES